MCRPGSFRRTGRARSTLPAISASGREAGRGRGGLRSAAAVGRVRRARAANPPPRRAT
jgi:hypothetical protein